MGAFTIWGRITHSAPGEFVVTVSAIPLQSEMAVADLNREPMVATVVAATRQQAEDTRQQAEDTRDMMVKALAEQLRDGGHQVLDVEVE